MYSPSGGDPGTEVTCTQSKNYCSKTKQNQNNKTEVNIWRYTELTPFSSSVLYETLMYSSYWRTDSHALLLELMALPPAGIVTQLIWAKAQTEENVVWPELVK